MAQNEAKMSRNGPADIPAQIHFLLWLMRCRKVKSTDEYQYSMADGEI
jgi:hypothetical protein